MGMNLVLSCEHGGNRVPERYRSLFADAAGVLATHRGWDPGSLRLARALARSCEAPLISTEVTRLLVEVNRSPDHPSLFSEFTRGLDDGEKHLLLNRYYHRHRNRVIRAIDEGIGVAEPGGRRERGNGGGRVGPVLHVGVHTFTPVWKGKERDVDIGILYDPTRTWECEAADRWLSALRPLGLRVRRNRPYRGDSDGLVTALRERYSEDQYVGLELEVSQWLAVGSGSRRGITPKREREIRRVLAEGLRGVLG